MKTTLLSGIAALTVIAPTQAFAKKNTSAKPNIIVVLLDDLGSGDVSFNGCKDILTPHIDRIAKQGVKCTNAYISAPYSGPSRAGILTGRYQQRCGAEGNTDNRGIETLKEKRGVPTSEFLMSEALKTQGYKTAAIGKWHLGEHPSMWPQEQGFDYFYGFAGGGFSYWGDKRGSEINYMQENGKEIMPTKTTYITDDFSDKAVDFINENAKDPFFIYLAYNAPHSALNASRKYLDRTTHIANPERSIYGAMILAVDDGVGRIWDALEEKGIEENTILIFLSDNGGASYSYSYNYPRRARKGQMFDGGTKTPFAMCWGKNIKAGSVYNKTISSLNIFPTVATAAGIDITTLDKKLDGVDMMPYFKGKKKDNPNQKLYWRVWGGMEYAMRDGDYKLVKQHHSEELELYNLIEDPTEITNIAANNQDIVKRMNSEYQKWSDEMQKPAWLDKHGPNLEKDRKAWEDARRRASGNR